MTHWTPFNAHARVGLALAVVWLMSNDAMATETDNRVSCQPMGALASNASAEAFCAALGDAVAEASDRFYDLRLLSFSSEHLAVNVRDLTDPTQPVRRIQRRMIDLVLTPDTYPAFAAQVVRSAIRQGTIIAR